MQIVSRVFASLLLAACTSQFASAQTPDATSDAVGATAGEFAVDAAGAATYSVPIYVVPGTAGVTPSVSLSYSSQGSDGPVGKGWTLSGLSSISRCRATREAGDYFSGGVPVDGDPPPINFTATDKLCLDGRRLVPAPAGAPVCAALTGFTVIHLRTELDAFQRVCSYTPTSGTNGPSFFSVESKDGSINIYGDRDGVDATADRPDGSVKSTALGHTTKALYWWQTRARDSTGNYIDYKYTSNPGGASYPGESVISSIEYTGKVALSGQTTTSAPYAKLAFAYTTRPAAEIGRSFVAEGAVWQTQLLDSITVIGNISTSQQARFYKLAYGTSASNSRAKTLTSVTECSTSAQTVCLAPTQFSWSSAVTKFSTVEPVATAGGSFEGMVSMRTGDIDGDGRLDVAWFKNVNESGCTKSYLYVSFGELDASSQQTFNRVAQTPWCIPRDVPNIDKAWHLLDYDGDGRDDFFVAGAGPNWSLHLSTGRPAAGGSVFNFASNAISTLTGGIPITADDLDLAILADLNGDALFDVIYPRANGGIKLYYARLMQRSGSNFVWGAERTLNFLHQATANQRVYWGFASLGGRVQGYDFDGDARTDPLFHVIERELDPDCIPPFAEIEQRQRSDEGLLRVTDPSSRFVASRGEALTEQRRSELQPGRDAAGDCFINKYYVMAFGVETTSSTVSLRERESWLLEEEAATIGNVTYITDLQYGDFNGDGLADDLYKHTTLGWRAHLNGNGPTQSLGTTLPNEAYLQLVDINGDGRSDLAYPQEVNSNYRPFWARRANADGTFESTGAVIAGGDARGCRLSTCDLTHTRFLFADFDADATVDYVAIYDNHSTHYTSRSASTDRFKPRDVITAITNGNGAADELLYSPLTLSDIYRRDTGARALTIGRGSAVQELMGPLYVVARSQGSAPVYNNPAAKSAIYYRYSGARVQAGGRGLLGFRQITSFDTTYSGQHMGSTTTYRQDFPFIGMPLETTQRVVSGNYSPSTCVTGTVANSCFSVPGTAFPALTGTLVSLRSSVWEASPAFAAGTQQALHVRLAGTDERAYSLNSGSQLSKVMTAFTYTTYGNVQSTAIDTYVGATATVLSSVDTLNVYTDDTAAWRLGRLSVTNVTYTRGAETKTRSTQFSYDLSGPKTGFLTMERVQPTVASDQDLVTYYTLDQFGNKTHAHTCSNELTEAACKTTAVPFRPGSAGAPTASVQRYARSTYDSIGRYVTATYEPFWNGSTATESATSTVVARNVFGDVTHARSVNGVDALAVFGNLGRPYYTWTETVSTATPGSAANGVETWMTYRTCGVAAGQVPCPVGARFRQQSMAEGAPTSWTYFDVLGRPLLSASQTMNVTANKMFSGVCTWHDATGRPERASEPFFLTSAATDTAPMTFAATVCTTARVWNETDYDVLGRATQITSADGTYVQSTYNNLTTTVSDENLHSTSQTKNAAGELLNATDAAGLTMYYYYFADGTLKEVSRDAGRGAVLSSYTYDALGRKKTQIDRDAGTWSYDYNAAGEVIRQTDAKGNMVEMHYDARGRVWQKKAFLPGSVLESTSTFTFDTAANGKGQLAIESISGSGALTRTLSYDALGRLMQRDAAIDAKTYREQTAYDTLGRPWKSNDASGAWVKTEFDARGLAIRTCESSAADAVATCGTTFFVEIEETDARGNAIREQRDSASGPIITRSYNSLSGRLVGVCTGISCTVQNDIYDHDDKGNLTLRERVGRYKERFQYDSADRVTLGWYETLNGVNYGAAPPVVNPAGSPPANLSFFGEYDKLGNLCRKVVSGLFAQYGYAGRAGCGTGGLGGSSTTLSTASAHQTTSLFGTGFSLANTYDTNGNSSTAGGARTYTYTAQNQATSVYTGTSGAPTERVRFFYGPDGGRYKRIDDGSAAGGTTTTTYFGPVERRVLPGGGIQWRREVAGVVQVQYTTESVASGITIATGTGTKRYLFHDGLGSVHVLGTVSGGSVTVLERYDYAPHGERRQPDPPFGVAVAVQTKRGFTGHEHVENLDLVHMNGRIYWPGGGKFLQPDPLVQSASAPQTWNAYSYVQNNPLSLTDPTGMFSISPFGGAIRAVMRAIGPDATGVAISACGFAGPWGILCAAGASYDATRAFGGTTSEARQAGRKAAFSSAIMYGVSSGLDAASAGYTTRVVAMGAAGGVASMVQGGKFGHGFVSAGFTTAVSPAIGQIKSRPAQGVVAAIVGGTVSEATGGKFANGAATAAMSYAFAEMARSKAGKVHRAGSDGGSRLCASDSCMKYPPDPGELEFVKSVAGKFDQLTVDADGWEYAAGLYQSPDETAYGISEPGTLESILGSAEDNYGEPSGYSKIGSIHSHPLARTYYLTEADVEILGRGQVGDSFTPIPLKFSNADIRGYRDNRQNGWAIPAGTGKILYFPYQQKGNYHYEYSWP